LAQGRGKGKGTSGAGGTSSGGTSSGGSGGGSSSGGSSGGSGSSSGGSGGASSGGGSSSGSGGGGTGGTKSGQSGAHAHKTAGSSSTTTQANNQSTVSVSTPNYSAALGYSTNSLTQGAGSASIVSASNVQQSQQTTGQANPVTMGVMPAANTLNASYQGTQGQVQYAQLVSKYGQETADKLATQTYISHQEARAMGLGTNTDNQYLQNENAAITNAEKRQQEFVNNNTFASNPQPRATAPIPNVITVSTPLYRQAGEKENPLTILEGNKFISPAQQFLPQENEQFAPRPEYGAFTNNPYIGVHQNSAIQPNADLSESQRKSPMDWLTDIRQHKYFPLAIVGIVVLVALSMFGGAKIKKASGGSRGVFRSTGGSGQPIITVVK
jgi:hypothetical protein